MNTDKVISINDHQPVTKESLILAINKMLDRYGDRCYICGSRTVDSVCMACEKAICSEHNAGGMICTECQSDIDNMSDEERKEIEAEIIAIIERGEQP